MPYYTYICETCETKFLENQTIGQYNDEEYLVICPECGAEGEVHQIIDKPTMIIYRGTGWGGE